MIVLIAVTCVGYSVSSDHTNCVVLSMAATKAANSASYSANYGAQFSQDGITSTMNFHS
jgi:hypothetical protein